ncbi:IucA/IucC family protein [Bacillus massilinigeriensis]|uniref:IucA/IucC family protein n=1 Tax=Bacillus mediterraneensis TaxID=1805474 RepID=UPI0008F965A5|nr:IucA/IucC family protein [Bacillus mediterraneensis]
MVIAEEVFLEEEEARTLSYIAEHKPELEGVFLKCLADGRRGIMQRLLQGLVRERIVKEEDVLWEGKELSIKLADDKELQVSIKQKFSFGRFDIEGRIIVTELQHKKELIHPVELLDLLRQEGVLQDTPEVRFQRFRQEIANGTANLALALAGAAYRKSKRKMERYKTSLAFVRKEAEKDPAFSPLAYYEQTVVEGHPLHPGAKTKFGLDVGEVIQYSPEWGGSPEIALAAVAKDCCRTVSAGSTTVTELLYNEYGGLALDVEKFLAGKGKDLKDYELIPLHPWQMKHTIGAMYREALGAGDIIPIHGITIPAKALVSFRSLSPVPAGGKLPHHIKTAVNIQTTSAVRLVSPNSVENGPALSRILNKIQKKENRFDGRFIVLAEEAGSYYQPPAHLSEEKRWNLQANLAAILRENPEKYVKRGKEIPMAAASLLAVSPISGKTITCELIEELASHRKIADLSVAAVAFITKYAERSLPGFITLMVRYGISLEGHMQNSISIFNNGEPVRILLRDFGGIRVMLPRLKKAGDEISLHPGSAIATEDETALRNIFSYAVLQNHFAELIACITREIDLEENVLWRQVAAVIQAVFAELKQDEAIRSQAIEDEEAIFQHLTDLKALTLMRLQGSSTVYPYSKVPNPLAQWKGE